MTQGVLAGPWTGAGPARAAVFFAALAAVPVLGTAHWVMNMLVFTLMYAVLASAWNMVGGMAGYPSLGHAAFFGLGAYLVAGWFAHHGVSSGFEPFLALPAVGVLAALAGLPVAAIAMRTRFDVFAIVTITVLFVVQTLAFNLRSLTGGAQGAAMPVAPFPADTFERPFYLVLLGLLALAMGLTWLAMRSKVGLSLAAVRADEDKAAAIGVRVQTVKLVAFCVSVGLTAMVGAVWAYYEQFVYPQFAVDPLVTIAMVLMTFLGGRATLWGPVIGAFLLELAQQYLAYSLGGSRFYLIAYAVVFLAVMLLMPRGIVPSAQERLRNRRLRATASAVPPGVPDRSVVAAGPSGGPPGQPSGGAAAGGPVARGRR